MYLGLASSPTEPLLSELDVLVLTLFLGGLLYGSEDASPLIFLLLVSFHFQL